MSDDRKLRADRDTPPKDDEWGPIWKALAKAEAGWIIIAPFHAVASNWKAIVVVLSIVVYIRGPDIIAAIKELLGPTL